MKIFGFIFCTLFNFSNLDSIMLFALEETLPCEGLLFYTPRVDALPEDTWSDFGANLFTPSEIPKVPCRKRGRPRLLQERVTVSKNPKLSPLSETRRVSNVLKARAFRHRRRQEEEKFQARLQMLAFENKKLLAQKKVLQNVVNTLTIKAREKFKIF